LSVPMHKEFETGLKDSPSLTDVIHVSLSMAKADGVLQSERHISQLLIERTPGPTAMVAGLVQREKPVLRECVAYEQQDYGYKSAYFEER
jgi:hypothetical protein